MLRVRPILFTPRFDEFSELLGALGLELVDDAPGRRIFAADSGRVAVQAADDPSTAFSFEVGAVDEFTRRTVESGTDAVVVHTADGRASRVTAPDGRTFLAYEAPLADAAPPTEGLTVMPIWYTTNVAADELMFKAIGAKKRPGSTAGSQIDFTAKNGGLLAVREADTSGAHTSGAELAFEFTGDVNTLQQRAALPAARIDENHGRCLRLSHPDGGEIRVNQRQP